MTYEHGERIEAWVYDGPNLGFHKFVGVWNAKINAAENDGRVSYSASSLYPTLDACISSIIGGVGQLYEHERRRADAKYRADVELLERHARAAMAR